jgi:polysaccharide export outer membrane protein
MNCDASPDGTCFAPCGPSRAERREVRILNNINRTGTGLLGGLILVLGSISAVATKAQNPPKDKPASADTTTSHSSVPQAGTKSNEPRKNGAPSAAGELEDGSTYRIGVEDELQISVWREPELSMPVQVRPDGMITLPLINDFPVVGLTTKELQAALTEKFAPFVNEPQVTVIVRNIRSRKVFLVGQVGKPGPYPLNGKMTVLQLIVGAGGLGQFAKGGSIYVVRVVNGQSTRLKFNFKKAVSGKGDGGDFELMPGDMVVVP